MNPLLLLLICVLALHTCIASSSNVSPQSMRTYRAAAVQYTPQGVRNGSATLIVQSNLNAFASIIQDLSQHGVQIAVCMCPEAIIQCCVVLMPLRICHA